MTFLDICLKNSEVGIFFRGHKVIAVTLLQHGADTTIRNSSGKLTDLLTQQLHCIWSPWIGCKSITGLPRLTHKSSSDFFSEAQFQKHEKPKKNKREMRGGVRGGAQNASEQKPEFRSEKRLRKAKGYLQ